MGVYPDLDDLKISKNCAKLIIMSYIIILLYLLMAYISYLYNSIR